MKTSKSGPTCCHCGAEAVGYYYSDARFYSLYCPSGCNEVRADTPDEAAHDWRAVNGQSRGFARMAVIAILAVAAIGALAGLTI